MQLLQVRICRDQIQKVLIYLLQSKAHRQFLLNKSLIAIKNCIQSSDAYLQEIISTLSALIAQLSWETANKAKWNLSQCQTVFRTDGRHSFPEPGKTWNEFTKTIPKPHDQQCIISEMEWGRESPYSSWTAPGIPCAMSYQPRNPGQPLSKCHWIPQPEGHFLPQWHEGFMLLILVLSTAFWVLGFVALIPQSHQKWSKTKLQRWIWTLPQHPREYRTREDIADTNQS